MNKIILFFCLVFSIANIVKANNDIYIYLIGGQSNATGQALVRNIPMIFKKDTTVLFFYSKFLNNGDGAEKWNVLSPASETKEKFGVELSLGTALKRYYPNENIAIIKHALAGSNLYEQWNPGNRDNEQMGEEYCKWLHTIKIALNDLKKRGLNPIIRAMLWQQGEADARDIAGFDNSRKYGENLKNFILQVRKDLNVPELLFVYGEVIPIPAKRFPGRELIRQAQIDVSTSSNSHISVSNAILVETDDLQMLCSDYCSPYPKDDVHLGTYGILELGERFAKAIVVNSKIK